MDSNLEAKLRKAFTAGFWAWCGPANERELEMVLKDEQEGWEKWIAENRDTL